MTKQISNAEVFEVMEKWAPKNLAYDWDNVGLQVGTYNQRNKKVMVTLDVLESVVDEAIEKDIGLIIAHHPLLFQSFKKIDLSTPKGRIIRKLINHDISVYASHTNLDVAVGGVNDILSDLLNIQSRSYLQELHTDNLYKFAVYTPQTHMNNVRDALHYSGAGYIGNYSHCTFETEGKGMFKPLEGTSPHIGLMNELTHVDEIKVETIVKKSQLQTVIASVLKAHPYEEVAYDIVPLVNKGISSGIGRIGYLEQKKTLLELSNIVKKVFDVPHVRVIGDLTASIHKVAILGGSGEKYISKAKQLGADVLITGDMTFHTAQDAQEMGLSIIDAGHYIEHVMKKSTQSYLEEQFKGKNITFIISKTNTEPFQFV